MRLHLRAMLSARVREWLQTLPSLTWLVAFVLVPSLLVLVFAFRTTGSLGNAGTHWTLGQFSLLAHSGTLALLARTFWISCGTTVLCIVLGLPVAWCIARAPSRLQPWLLLLVVVPFWTNFLIRVFAWNQILHSDGFLAHLLRTCRLMDARDTLLYHPLTVVLVSVHAFLPFAILPLHAATEKFDFGLLDAARDLGASPARAFWSIYLPAVRAGLLAAATLVFIPMLGSYVIPELVGGMDGQMIGNLIARRNFADRNLPSAAALCSALSFAVLLPLAALRFLRPHSRHPLPR